MLFTRNAQDPIYNSLSDINSGTPINAWFRQLFNSPRQLEKHYPLAILAFFDFSFLNYILEENPNVSVSRTIFKKSSDEKISSYYPVISKFKMLLLRHLMDAHNIARLQGM